MNKLTLVIPAKYEKNSLPIVLQELENLDLDKIIVIPPYDSDTKEAIKDFNLFHFLR